MDNDAYTGSTAKNPFTFKHFSASHVAIYLDGEMPAPSLKLHFVDNQYIDGYRSLFATTGRIDMDNGLDITRTDYNLVIVFLDSTHLLFFVIGSLKNGKEMVLCV